MAVVKKPDLVIYVIQIEPFVYKVGVFFSFGCLHLKQGNNTREV